MIRLETLIELFELFELFDFDSFYFELFDIFLFRAFRDPLVEIRQTAPCRAIRGNCISVNNSLPPLVVFLLVPTGSIPLSSFLICLMMGSMPLFVVEVATEGYT